MRRALEAAEKHEEGQLIGRRRAGRRPAAPRSWQSHGLEEVPVERGTAVRPRRIHEAVMTQPPTSIPEGTVIQRPGARLHCCTAGCCGRPRSSWPAAGDGRLLPDARRRPRTPRRTRSRRRSASSRASTTRTRTRATRRSEEKFKEVNEAYETLSDPEKRKQYDELSCASAPSARAGGGFRPGRRRLPGLRPAHVPAGQQSSSTMGDLGDLSRQPVRRRGGRRAAAARRRAAERGADLQADVTVSFDDVAARARPCACRSRSPTPARRATAAGAAAGHDAQGLPGLPGPRRRWRSNQGPFAISQPCPRCHGNGTIIESTLRDLQRHAA